MIYDVYTELCMPSGDLITMNAKIISNFLNATSAGVSTTKSYNPAQEKEMFYKTDKWGQVHIEKFFLWVVRDKFDF